MNWHNLVTKNMLRNLQRYLGYMLAATLAVMVFAMFTNFVDNPAIRDAQITATASQLLIVFRVFVALFAIFFIFYFHAALIRARNKEFGLLLTLGVTPRQIGWLIFYESVFIGLIALLMGIGLGIVCAYFFQIAMLALLALPVTIPFTVPSSTFISTGTFFGIVFLLDAVWISLQVTRRTPRVLLLGARTQQEPPRVSWRSVLLGLICIGAAYYMALQLSRAILLNMFPIIGITIFGTYLLFSQCAVMLLNRLRRPGISGMRLLLLARLSHRMRDYARMLTVVTVLNAVVLTGMGAIFGGLQVFNAQQGLLTPLPLQFSTNEAHPAALTPTQVQQEIKRQHFTLQTVTHTSLVTGSVVQGTQNIPVSVIAVSSFIQLQEVELQANPNLATGQNHIRALTNDAEGHFATPDFVYNIALQHSQLVVDKTTVDLQLDMNTTRILNTWMGISTIGPATNVVVVTDALYAKLAQQAALDQRWQVYSYVLPNWQQSAPLVATLRQQLPESQQSLLTDAVTHFNSGRQIISVTLFADFFISCLFFLAAGSAIYFKLFTQQEEDRRQFHALERIGFQRREAAQLLNREFLLLFFIPIFLAIVHSVVALIDFSNLFISQSHSATLLPKTGVTVLIMQAFIPIALLYLGSFAIYFWISRVSYLRKMQLAAA